MVKKMSEGRGFFVNLINGSLVPFPVTKLSCVVIIYFLIYIGRSCQEWRRY